MHEQLICLLIRIRPVPSSTVRSSHGSYAWPNNDSSTSCSICSENVEYSESQQNPRTRKRGFVTDRVRKGGFSTSRVSRSKLDGVCRLVQEIGDDSQQQGDVYINNPALWLLGSAFTFLCHSNLEPSLVLEFLHELDFQLAEISLSYWCKSDRCFPHHIDGSLVAI